MEEVKKALDEEILTQITALGYHKTGSEEYATTAKVVNDLLARSAEIERIVRDDDNKRLDRNFEYDYKAEVIVQDEEDRKMKNKVEIAKIAVPAALTAVGSVAIIVLEKQGGYISGFAQSKFLSRLFNK